MGRRGKTEDRTQESEDRSQKTGVRRQESGIGGRQEVCPRVLPSGICPHLLKLWKHQRLRNIDLPARRVGI